MAATGPRSDLWVQKQLDLASLNAKRNKMMFMGKQSRVKKCHSDGTMLEPDSQHNGFIQDHLIQAKSQLNGLPERLKLPKKNTETSQKQDLMVPSAQPPLESTVEMDEPMNSLFAKWNMNSGRFEREVKSLLKETGEKAAQSIKGLVFW
jgi:hypothetical protein